MMTFPLRCFSVWHYFENFVFFKIRRENNYFVSPPIKSLQYLDRFCRPHRCVLSGRLHVKMTPKGIKMLHGRTLAADKTFKK